MSSPQENELSHPLEQVTGEKDVPPEEEDARQDAAGDEGAAGPDAGEDPAGQEAP